MTETLYGENAVTGTVEDAKQPAIEIIDNGQKQTLPKEAVAQNDPKGKLQDPPTESAAAENAAKEEDPHKDLKDKLLQNETLKEEGFKAKGLDFEAIRTEFDQKGELTEETYQKLEKAGYPKGAVDAIIRGLEATTTQFVNTVYQHVGGEEAFQAIQEYVKAQGQKAVESFNRVVNSKDIDLILLAMDGLKAQMTLKQGTNTQHILGNKGAAQSMTGFASKAEMVAAMSDPKYQKDPAYRQMVQNKVIMSKF